MTTRLTRQELASFLGNHRLIKAFETIDEAVANNLPDPGGSVQLTADAALELATAQRLGIFSPRQQLISLRAGDGIQVTPDAAGFTVTVDLGFLVSALRAYLPRSTPPVPAANDSQAILANKIFGR